MFPITITLHTAAQLNAVMAALGASVDESSLVNPAAKAEAPGKPSAVKTVRSQPTAEAGPSAAGPSAVAHEPPTEATKPTAGAASASPQVTYPELQKAVLTLHKMDPTAAVPIAKGLGADTFKALPDTKWAEALRLVNAAIEARKEA